MNDDYLWNREEPAAPEIARLERALARQRRPESRRLDLSALTSTPRAPRRPRMLMRIAAAAVVLCSTTLLLRLASNDTTPTPIAHGSTPYSIETIEGDVAVSYRDRALTLGDARLPPGSIVTCAPTGRARLRVDRVGSMILEGGSRMRIDDSIAHDDDSGYFVHLDKGSLRATIFAAPRLFQIGTPGGIAVDLGCIYRATVRADGSTLLAVESGAVSFEAMDHRVYVPSNAESVARPGFGPGTPVWSDAPAEYKSAVERLDATSAPDRELVATVLAPQEPRATLTYIHLLAHDDRSVREAALARVTELEPDAKDLDREALLTGDRREAQKLLDTVRGDWHW